MRRGRRSSAAMSFFSFQDVITSVTGILLLITLMLILDLASRPQSQAPRSDERTILVEQLAQTQQQHTRAQAELEDVRRQLALLDELARTSYRPGEMTQRTEALAQRVVDLQRQQQLARQQAEATERRVEALLVQVQQADAAIEALLQQASAVQDNARAAQGQIAFIPGKSTKSPLIVELSDQGLRIGSLDASGRPRLLASSSSRQAERTIRTFCQTRRSSTEYFVVFVRPEGVGLQPQVLAEIQAAGFEVGWDAAPAKALFSSDPEGSG